MERAVDVDCSGKWSAGLDVELETRLEREAEESCPSCKSKFTCCACFECLLYCIYE